LHPPKNVTFTGQSPSLTRLKWISSSFTQGTTDGYTVKICDAFEVCNSTDGVQKCVHQETPLPWLEFVTTPDTEYCVLVASTALCGQDTIKSSPTAALVRTPSLGKTEPFSTPCKRLADIFLLKITTLQNTNVYLKSGIRFEPVKKSPAFWTHCIHEWTFCPAPPDVTNLTLEGIGVDSFTVAWERPRGDFDYYIIAASDEESDSGGGELYRVDACRNGTILRPNQTRLTCGHLEACSTFTFNIRTYIVGTPG
ncbi:hypothetical protein V5799_000564, partial [Amblyomma americanum]